MTCEYELGEGWKEHHPSGLLYKRGKVLQLGGMQIIISTGGVNEPTKILIKGGKQLDCYTTGKVKPWSFTAVDLSGFNLYGKKEGKDASVSLLSPKHPYHLKVTHLPKVKV